MAFCCCCQSLFRCALTEAAALPLQFLKSHDALAGGCCYSCFGRWLCLYCVSGMLIVLDAIVVYMTLAIWVSCRWKGNVEHLSLFVFERVRCMNKEEKELSATCIFLAVRRNKELVQLVKVKKRALCNWNPNWIPFGSSQESKDLNSTDTILAQLTVPSSITIRLLQVTKVSYEYLCSELWVHVHFGMFIR